MAKDREKLLFRGADDKAITFQRAVFIVCNLKRLIRRPKKEDRGLVVALISFSFSSPRPFELPPPTRRLGVQKFCRKWRSVN